MHTPLTERLHEMVSDAIKASGVGARQFEEMHGLKKWALRGLLDPERMQAPSIDKAQEICDALGLSLQLGAPRDGLTLAATRENFVPIPLHSAELAAGDGHHNEREEVIGELAFRRDWLRRIGVSPTSAVLARARGDSMVPTIRDGDMMLIDRARASPPTKVRAAQDMRIPHIFALLDQDGGARVKRLDLASPGQLALLSDNHEHSPEFRPVAEVSIIGRVVWWGHTEKEC